MESRTTEKGLCLIRLVGVCLMRLTREDAQHAPRSGVEERVRSPRPQPRGCREQKRYLERRDRAQMAWGVRRPWSGDCFAPTCSQHRRTHLSPSIGPQPPPRRHARQTHAIRHHTDMPSRAGQQAEVNECVDVICAHTVCHRAATF
eukprot:2862015-Rhodomonas_salina.1